MASVFTNPREIKSDESHRWWPAAAGVAAALVASLTAFAAPIDGARAAPPTSNVNVVNPAIEPALTRSVDEPGRIAYQSATTCAVGSDFCNFVFPEVPKGHRLVVQHVSGQMVFASDTPGVQLGLTGGTNEGGASFLAPPSFRRNGLFDQPVLQYFDGGSIPVLFASPDATIQFGTATISGYLLNCATTPCQPIAP
jgi:hypothetical protein